MSKSTNGANITAEDILRMNPDLLGQVGQAPPQSIPEPMPEPGPAPMTTDQAIANFYGSGDRITQPDMAYYDEFPLPGDTGRAPVAESSPMPVMSGPQPGTGAAGSGMAAPFVQPMQMPAEVMAAMATLSRSGRGGRKNARTRRKAREVIDRFEEDPASFAPPPPVNLAGMNLSAQMPSGQPTLAEGDRFKYGQADATGLQRPVRLPNVELKMGTPAPMPAPIPAPMPAQIPAPMSVPMQTAMPTPMATPMPAPMPVMDAMAARRTTQPAGPMVPIFDFEEMERGMRFGR